jgi:hypothetical protein
VALAALLGGACAADPAREADRAFTAGVARVKSIELTLVSVRPPRLRVDVRGSLPDACTEIDPIDPRLLGPKVEITLATRRPFGAKCAPAETPFERSIPLMLSDEVRAYVVDVNGVRGTVLLPPDADPDPFDADR